MPPYREGIPTLRWIGGIDGHLYLLDQTRLPTECIEIECRDVEAVWEAIRAPRTGRTCHRHSGGLRGLSGRSIAARRKRDPISDTCQHCCRFSGYQPAHGGQSVLGQLIAKKG